MNTRFYIDPITELPHLYNHNVNEEEAIEVLNYPIEDRMGDNDARVAVGQTRAGRYLRVIYVHDDEPNSVFITAYNLPRKQLHALNRRRKKKS